MHNTSFEKMGELIPKYVPQNSNVLDIGSRNDIWNYKEQVDKNNCQYLTLDWENNADFIVNGYDWSMVPKDFDCVISGQCLEHDGFFWKTLSNISSITKSGGIIIIIVPSCGAIHRYPVDCYRFYPDSAKYFAEIMNAEVLEVHHLGFESEWGDLSMVFRKN
jgi:SAM-dependent methyltransferase